MLRELKNSARIKLVYIIYYNTRDIKIWGSNKYMNMYKDTNASVQMANIACNGGSHS